MCPPGGLGNALGIESLNSCLQLGDVHSIGCSSSNWNKALGMGDGPGPGERDLETGKSYCMTTHLLVYCLPWRRALLKM